MRTFSWGESKKSLLDVIIEKIRYKKVSELITPGSTILDLGCGHDASLLRKYAQTIRYGVGIDISVSKEHLPNNIELIEKQVELSNKLKPNSFDTIFALALLEHLSKPKFALSESYKLLKRGGKLVITTPSQRAKAILEFMAYRLKLIDQGEISDHKHYYSKNTLLDDLIKCGFSRNNVNIKTFEFGLNLFAVAKK